MDYLQYVDKDSFMHRLDPRTKFVFFLVMAILTSLVKSGVALVFLLASFLIMWGVCGIMAEMLKLVKQLKVLLIFIFLLWFVLGLFEEPPITGGPKPFFQGTVLNMEICFDWYDFYKGVVYALRIFLMIASFFMVLVTTNFSEIILGLCKWHIPYALAFGIGLVFQIIPIIISELHAIMDAQSSRGLEIERCGTATKIKNYITFSIPLLFRVIGKGHSISLAMHFYKLNFSVKRTSYKSIKASKYDAFFGLATFAVIAATVVLRIFFYIPV